MASSTWLLPETCPGHSVIDFQIGPADVPGAPDGWSVVKKTLTSGASAGVELVEIDNGRMKIILIPTRGMGVWAARIGEERLGWTSPVRGPVHPRHVSLMEPTGIGWLDGFDELMVRCGLESSGSPVFDDQSRLIYPLHGRIGNRPAHSIEVSVDLAAGAITVSAVVDELRFHYQKLRLIAKFTTKFGSSAFSWDDEVINLAGKLTAMQMLYHINVGDPLLTPGSQLVAPIRAVSPHDFYPEPERDNDYQTYYRPGEAPPQQSFFFDLAADDVGDTEVLLKNAVDDRGLAIRFNKSQLPWFTQWKQNATAADGYLTGLEPGTNFPNPRPFEERHDRIVTLQPGASWRGHVELEWLMSRDEVVQAVGRVKKLQGHEMPICHDVPLPKWSAKAN